VPDLFPGPVLASLRADPDHPAFEIGPRTVSRSDLLAMVRRLTAVPRDAGLGPGEGVGLVLSLSAEAYATHLAAPARGCGVVAAQPGWSLGRLGHAVDRQVDAVIADTPLERPALPLDELLDTLARDRRAHRHARRRYRRLGADPGPGA
jgi:acyl-CoA synthetase (AMP-forming)/AMP-acid ligase II